MFAIVGALLPSDRWSCPVEPAGQMVVELVEVEGRMAVELVVELVEGQTVEGQAVVMVADRMVAVTVADRMVAVTVADRMVVAAAPAAA